jgi:hypothetical protein
MAGATDAGEDEAGFLLFGGEAFFDGHGNGAVEKMSGAGAALALSAGIWNGDAGQLGHFQNGHVAIQFEAAGGAQEFNRLK